MQPEQPPSSEAQPVADVQAAEDGSEPIEQTSQGTPWWRRMVPGHIRARSEPVEAEDQPPPAEASRITLTQEELDRRVQAETDRREAKRHAQALADRRRKLRDEDPWQYAEEDRQAERTEQSTAQVSDLFSGIGREHDKYTLDPLVESLPRAERERILALEGAGQGLDGRKLIVTESLKALEKHWKDEGAKDAEARLRRNQAFRKQLLNESRRGLVEPAIVQGTGSSDSDGEGSVSNILREQIRARH